MEASSTNIRIDELVSRSDRFETDVKERFDKVDKRFDKLESKVDATNRTIWAGIFVAAMIKILLG